MNHREKLLERLQVLDELDEEHLPLVTLDEYFQGNDQEQSIAPNQWEFGRPSIARIHAHFKALEQRPDVQGVYVGLHQEWGEALESDDWPAAENIHIYSSAPLAVAEQWLEGLEADGIGEGWPYGKHAGAPEPRAGYHVYTVYWD
ncbi:MULTISPECIES: hypothetical protein [Pseudomonas]|uniref:Uncharacterized protein n=1 Tax=Pseudomonas piscis TaxID=2614538 RepID=A0ABY9N9Z9_9PSED|nr:MULTISPECIES: hypothetical protein [Pseudomonas]POA57455.1 hypothetical protein C1889_07885 [Pseudomonas sp. FW507-12TSA]WMN15323.1 hypothetical protein QL104_18310 [Pseudomonas piscis]